jgi:plastocyanin
MKKILIGVAVLAVLGGGYYFLSQPSSPEEGVNGVEENNGEKISGVKSFDLTGENFSFSQSEIRVRKGDTVRITFESTDGFHDWTIDEFDAKTEQVNPGETTSVEFVVDQVGAFEYYCSVGNHREQGMIGSLIVEEASAMMEEEGVTSMLMAETGTQTATLVAVDGSDSSGTAYRLLKDGVLSHALVATLPDPSEGNVYEGWLVQPSPLEFFSTGMLEKNSDGMWQLEYVIEGNIEYPFESYTRTIVTEEVVVDDTPEGHILEGDFE